MLFRSRENYKRRVKINEIKNEEKSFLSCEIKIQEDTNYTKDLDVYAQSLLKKFERLLVLSKRELSDSISTIKKLKDPSQIADNIASNLNLQIIEKQEILEIFDVRKRLEKVFELVEKEVSVISVEKKIRGV